MPNTHCPSLTLRFSLLVAAIGALLLTACPPLNDPLDAGTRMFTVGGTVTGLVGTGLILQNNLGDDLAITANGTFTFATALESGAQYVVTVKTHPSSPAQTCAVLNYTGTIGSSNVTTVAVNCSTDTYSVGGAVSGLVGTGLVLQNNLENDLAITNNGTFTFANRISPGGGYTVTVKAQPLSPSQTCTVTNNTGTIAEVNVTDVNVICSTNTYAVGGTVTGLVGTGLVLQNNLGDDLPLASDGPFNFATTVASGAAYSVTVKTQPTTPAQTCLVTNGAANVPNGPVTDVAIACTTNTYAVGGTVTGLVGTGLVLQNNLGDDLPITTNGPFNFATTVASGTLYSVTVKIQPASPSQTCTLANATGTVANGPVTAITLACITNTYALSGTVSGLAGFGLILQNNLGDDLTIGTNGTFTFATPVTAATPYAVTVKTQPVSLSQTCIVTNSAGTMPSGPVTNVAVTCATNTYNISGTINGLAGSGLVLQNNAADDYFVANNGPFTFGTAIASGSSYSVTVKTQPTSPLQTCTVTNGTGAVTSAAITNVSVVCATMYSLGGTIVGLASSGLTLASPGEPDLSVPAGATAFTFAVKLPAGSPYTVSITTQPTTQRCLVDKGSGTVATDVTSVAVSCTPWSQVAAGSSHTLAINTAGMLWVWGYSYYNYGSVPARVGYDTSWMAIAGGGEYTVALKSDGTIWTWGDNSEGQLGTGNSIPRSNPGQVGTGYVSVAAGGYHTVALKADGTLLTWGSNDFGQLGDGTTDQSYYPVGVGTGYTSVAAGGYHTIALKTDGSLWAWGSNGYGQLGIGTTADQLTPVRVGTDTSWMAIAAGERHTVALKTDGSLWAWGWNGYGQLGDATMTDRLTPVQVGTGYASVAAGGYHTIALKTDGSLWAWGWNAYGQLGDGTTATRTVPTRVGTDTSWMTIAAGGAHTVALKSDGTLWIWGHNNLGQLGTGNAIDRLSPTIIP